MHSDPAQVAVPAPSAWSTPSPPRRVQTDWIHQLGDERLPALVSEAMAHNNDLRLAAARLGVARAEARIEAAREGLTVDLSGRAVRRGTPVGDGSRLTRNDFETSLDAAWEADVWGRLSDATEAASLQADARAADLAAARLSIAANVAQAWFNAVAAELQVRLAESTVNNFEDNLAIVEDGFRSGLNAALDVRLERANLAGARARLESRRVDRQAAVRTLQTLLGRYPDGTLALTERMPTVQSTVPTGLPSELLERRPDIRAAALRIESTDRRQDQARKGRLPEIRLTGSGGLSSDELRSFLDFDALFWSIATGLLAPVLDAGRIDAEVDLAAARADEALAGYAAVVLEAFREVETALGAEELLAAQERALAAAAVESDRAENLALERYRSGLVDIITWLEARRRAFDANSALIEVSNRRLQNRVALYLALGGDFGSDDYTTAITIGTPEPATGAAMSAPMSAPTSAKEPAGQAASAGAPEPAAGPRREPAGVDR